MLFQFFFNICGLDLVYDGFSELVGIGIENKITLISILSCMLRGQTLHVNKFVFMRY